MLENTVKSFAVPADNSIKETENGLEMQSKRNIYSAGGLLWYAVGWCERDVTRVCQTGKGTHVNMEFYRES